MRRDTFRYIESEVYSYHDTLKEIKLVEYELLNDSKTAYDDVQSGRTSVRTITDSTAKKATALIDNRRLTRMRDKTGAIQEAYENMIPEKRELIRLYYWEKPGELTWEGVAKELNIGRRTAIRWRKTFIHEVGRRLGEN